MVKVIRTLVMAAVVMGLTVSSMGSVFAAEPSLIPVLSIVGTVADKGEINNDEGFIELKMGKGGLVEVLVTSETKYNIPGKEEATFEDIKIGDRVRVVATNAAAKEDDTMIIASSVTVLPQFVYRPQLVKKVWIKLPPKQIKEIWLDIPAQQIKRVWIDLPVQQIKQIWIHLKPETN